MQGGSGKTVAAVAIAKDPQVRSSFEAIVYTPLGSHPAVRDNQRSLYFQLKAAPMDANAAAREDSATEALRQAGRGRKLLLILDDAWQAATTQLLLKEVGTSSDWTLVLVGTYRTLWVALVV